MAGTIRHKANASWSFISPIEEGVDVAIGDLLFQESCYGVPVDQKTGMSGEDNFQEFVHANFLGISEDSVLGTETGDTDILVSAEGHYEYPTNALAAASCVGALVGVSVDPATGLPYPQQLEIVTAVNESIGVLVKPAAIGDTRLHVRLWSTLVGLGGIQTIIV